MPTLLEANQNYAATIKSVIYDYRNSMLCYADLTNNSSSTAYESYALNNWSRIKYQNTVQKWTATLSTTITAHYWQETSSTSTCASYLVEVPAVSLSDRLKEMIRSNMAPSAPKKRFDICHPEDVRESRARESLRLVIGEEAYQRFLRRGFVSVKAKSGRIYTIYRGHGLTGVYENGQLVQRLCADLKGGFAPTDSLLARYFMILHDEQGFLDKCNVFEASTRNAQPANEPQLRLVDRFTSLKSSHAKAITSASKFRDLRIQVA